MLKKIKNSGADIQPIFSYNSQCIDTRFGKAKDFISEAEEICGKNMIGSIYDSEPIGPQNKLDAMIVAPCTGNSIAKLNSGIVDSPVLMAIKAHIRNNKPVIIALATNDALGVSLKNIGGLMIRKNFYFVPFGQDNPYKKPLSMIADFEKIPQTIEEALLGKQIQPILL
jgi:dipicolinate synthase subunit B